MNNTGYFPNTAAGSPFSFNWNPQGGWGMGGGSWQGNPDWQKLMAAIQGSRGGAPGGAGAGAGAIMGQLGSMGQNNPLMHFFSQLFGQNMNQNNVAQGFRGMFPGAGGAQQGQFPIHPAMLFSGGQNNTPGVMKTMGG